MGMWRPEKRLCFSYRCAQFARDTMAWPSNMKDRSPVHGLVFDILRISTQLLFEEEDLVQANRLDIRFSASSQWNIVPSPRKDGLCQVLRLLRNVFRRQPNWSWMEKTCEAFRIARVGNGDIRVVGRLTCSYIVEARFLRNSDLFVGFSSDVIWRRYFGNRELRIQKIRVWQSYFLLFSWDMWVSV